MPHWWSDHVHPADLPTASEGIARVLKAGQHTHRYRVQHRAGGYRWIRDEMTLQRDADGKPTGIVGVWIDITESQVTEEKIYKLANIDPLTELPNRRLLHERLHDSLAQARLNESHGALLFVDLDRFKAINDMRGHLTGDAVLSEIARRLESGVRAHTHDTVARIGGDEFVVLLPGIAGSHIEAADRAATIGRKLIDMISEQPIGIDEQEFHLGASIGFTVFPKQDDTVESLIREADTAMYQAKSADTNVVMFQPVMHLSLLARHAVEDEIRHALKTSRFEIWLQDQVSAAGEPVGAEALVRLRGRDGRILQPFEFIGIAESSGLIVPLGRWVLTQACAVLARIRRDKPDWRMSVNVSPKQFRHPDFVADVTATLQRYDIPAGHLTLEITENLLIKDIAETKKIMRILSDRGARFAVDDFGTGYSSLYYLQNLPINEIKIDKNFIAQLPDDKSAAVITGAIIALAHSFDLDVVAEGVETSAHAAFLRERGCSMMQGYFFSKPIPVNEWFARSLQKQKEAASPKHQPFSQITHNNEA